ncbi:hypothetical protein MRX96_047869 [Rhipicephalus microplus]
MDVCPEETPPPPKLLGDIILPSPLCSKVVLPSEPTALCFAWHTRSEPNFRVMKHVTISACTEATAAQKNSFLCTVFCRGIKTDELPVNNECDAEEALKKADGLKLCPGCGIEPVASGQCMKFGAAHFAKNCLVTSPDGKPCLCCKYTRKLVQNHMYRLKKKRSTSFKQRPLGRVHVVSTKAIAPRSSSYHCGCDRQVSTSADPVVAQYRGTMEEMRQPLDIVRDDQQSTEHESVFRANLTDENAVNEWMETYSVRTNTSWIVWRVQSVGERMTFHKIWRCQHDTKNKKSGPRNAKCMAKVDVKIKLVTFDTKRRDKYLQREVPLSAVIRIDDRHSHSTDSADALRLLRGTRSTRQTFLRYFSEGITPSEARRLHESKLSIEDNGPAKLANAALNPPQRTVYYWHSV